MLDKLLGYLLWQIKVRSAYIRQSQICFISVFAVISSISNNNSLVKFYSYIYPHSLCYLTTYSISVTITSSLMTKSDVSVSNVSLACLSKKQNFPVYCFQNQASRMQEYSGSSRGFMLLILICYTKISFCTPPPLSASGIKPHDGGVLHRQSRPESSETHGAPLLYTSSSSPSSILSILRGFYREKTKLTYRCVWPHITSLFPLLQFSSSSPLSSSPPQTSAIPSPSLTSPHLSSSS